MAKTQYALDLCRSLMRRVADARLLVPYVPPRYERDDVLEINFTTVWPEHEGRGRFRVRKFVGSGFAGQVYPCVLEKIELPEEAGDCGLTEGGIYAVKIMIPDSRFSRRFRDILYWLGFQGPFSAQVNRAACRAGLIWQKLARLAARDVFGRDDAVADVYATFYDAGLRAHGEIREWVEGRMWRLEADITPHARRAWQTVDPRETGSPEYVAKRQFMYRFVRMLHDMGGAELARQYEWWTMKSQPNVMKRAGFDADPAAGLCAVDFRAGLALLPYLPMSPRDITLILEGLGRGSLVQFDRCDFDMLRRYAAEHAATLGPYAEMIDALDAYDRAYRRSLPDLSHQGLRLLTDRTLRADVRAGLVEGYAADGLVDEAFAARLRAGGGTFAAFYLLGAIPGLGRFLRRLWGNAAFRAHTARRLTNWPYFLLAGQAGAWRRLVEWHRAGRTGEARTAYLAEHPVQFWTQRLTLGLLPAGLHRCLAEPSFVWNALKSWWVFMRTFYKDSAFREQWLRDSIDEGHKSGMLDDGEHGVVTAQVGEPFIAKYLKSVAVHLATLPVTQIVSVICGSVLAAWLLATGRTDWKGATVWFLGTLAFFQMIPVSPGSLCRGFYVVYLVVSERNFRDYMVAAPLSFLKYIGYLAFPIQMAARYPVLSRFMAGKWATDAVHIIPVFGEKGALMEHFIFDLFFNYPRVLGRWASSRMRWLLDIWLLFGVAMWTVIFVYPGMLLTTLSGARFWKVSVNATLAVICLCILPRVLFYPLITKKRRAPDRSTPDGA